MPRINVNQSCYLLTAGLEKREILVIVCWQGGGVQNVSKTMRMAKEFCLQVKNKLLSF